MYLLDEFKGHEDYERLLYLEAISAGSCCTLARALLANIEAYMGAHGDRPDAIHPSVRLTMNSLRDMFAMRDDWLNRLRDMRLADRAPLPFDEKIGASVPITTQTRAKEATRVIGEAAQAGSDADIDRIFDRAREAVGLPADETPPTRRRAPAKRKKPAAVAG